jgi:glycosyltransferase involved in cell wall biosynthesis
MKIAFYSPLKSPNHPVPSGDRLMARLLIAAMQRGGHEVEIASELRTFTADPDSPAHELAAAAEWEIERIAALWQKQGRPDLWFCYHPYYKAPDLIGPTLAARFDLAYATAEASYSARRNKGRWAESQAGLLKAVQQAAVNICMTERDLKGLAAVAPEGRFVRLKPFIDPSVFLASPTPEPGRLVTVAMMRAGDKMDSYAMLADALSRLLHLAWTLTIIGDGAMKADVEARFAHIPPERLDWQGEKTSEEIAALLSRNSIYLWPGYGEAYGLAYLEAQAAGLPVIAQNVAGVPEVIEDGVTGLLTLTGDVDAYAQAIARLLADDAERQRMAKVARRFVHEERGIDEAARCLNAILQDHMGQKA